MSGNKRVKRANNGESCPAGQFDPARYGRKCSLKPMESILEHIGGTPMVKLQKIPQSREVKCEVFAKCEFFNAGGSVKDRIGKRMVDDAEKSGRIKVSLLIIHCPYHKFNSYQF
jgi:hypothetical protein